MANILNILVILNVCIYTTSAKYDVDILEVGCNSATPDLFEIELKVVRPSRGVFRFSGYANLKVDLDADATIIAGKIFYSSNGITYTLTPFHIGPQSLTLTLNYHYKQYSMDAMMECCLNAPVVGVFVSPLTKRLLECDNCPFPSDNFPTGLRRGYYRVMMLVSGGPAVNCSFLLKLELE